MTWTTERHELLLDSFLASFSEYPWRSPWCHSKAWDLEAVEVLDLVSLTSHWSLRYLLWVNWVFWSWLWRGPAYLPAILLWLDVAVEVEVVLEELESAHSLKFLLKTIAKSLPRLMKTLTLEADLKTEQLRVQLWDHAWHLSFAEAETSELVPERPFCQMNSPDLSTDDSWVATLTSWTLWCWIAFSLTNRAIVLVLSAWPPLRLTTCMPVMTSCLTTKHMTFWGEVGICNLCAGAATEHEPEHALKKTMGDLCVLLNTHTHTSGHDSQDMLMMSQSGNWVKGTHILRSAERDSILRTDCLETQALARFFKAWVCTDAIRSACFHR